MAEPKVQVETVKIDADSRQIRTKTSTAELLQNRRGDIEAAVSEASSIIQGSVAKVEDKPGWRLTTLEARFGITLAAEAGVILSRVSAEASFEVTVTIERH